MTAVAESMEQASASVQSPLQRIEHGLSPWVTFFIVPIFALSNAGIDFRGVSWGSVLAQPITLGDASGLIVGKFVGISLFSWLGVTCGLGRLPTGVSWKQLMGAAWLGGIGFTMSLFIAQLAFQKEEYIVQAKVGIFLASAMAAVVWGLPGCIVLRGRSC